MRNKVYDVITDRILAALKKGVAPWQRPWKRTCVGGVCASFWNLKSKKPYRGMNVFILASTGFSTPWWVSYKQCVELGGRVRAGETGTPVIFWKIFDASDPKADNPSHTKRVPFLRYYTVFNALEQCEGLEDMVPGYEEKEELDETVPVIREAAVIIEDMPDRPEIIEQGDRACYNPSTDRVKVPPMSSFISPEHFYSTLFHELGHSTGHEKRLNRKGVVSTEGEWSVFGSPSYAKEELVAEMTAAFLCGEAGIEGIFESSAAYLEHWRKHISDDPTLVVHAAGAAQRAADFILGKLEKVDAKDPVASEVK